MPEEREGKYVEEITVKEIIDKNFLWLITETKISEVEMSLRENTSSQENSKTYYT